MQLLSLSLLFQTTVFCQSCVITKWFEGHTETINGIAQSPNGKYFLSGGDDDKAILWDESGLSMKFTYS